MLDLQSVEAYLRRRMSSSGQVDDLTLSGAGDVLRLEADVHWKAMVVRVELELGELRLHHRRLGLRILRLSALGGIPLPRRVLEMILQRAAGDEVTVFPGDGIVVVDLRRWIPPELEVTVLTVQVTERTLELWLGAGRLLDLPSAQPPPRLPASTTVSAAVRNTPPAGVQGRIDEP